MSHASFSTGTRVSKVDFSHAPPIGKGLFTFLGRWALIANFVFVNFVPQELKLTWLNRRVGLAGYA